MKLYPVAPLAAAVGLPEGEMCARVGWSGKVAKKRRAEGMTETVADLAAVKLGLTPWQVWPDWAEDRKATCVECGEGFFPSRKGHTYCTPGCFKRHWDREAARRRYQADPAFRAKQLERAKRYRQTAKKAVLVKQRAWRAANAEQQREYRRAYYEANRERILARQRERDRARRAGQVAA